MSDGQLLVLELDGTPRERGRKHGEELRALIHEHRRRWADVLGEETDLDEKTYISEFLADTRFLPAIEKYTPELLEEVKGIAEGAVMDFDWTLVRQLSDEEPWYRRDRFLPMHSESACSSIGVDATANQPTLISQNMDSPFYHQGLQLLLKLSGPDMPVSVYNYSLAGKINLCGMNSAGVGICCNTISQLDYSRTGLPEDFVVRGFLAHASLDDALGFMYHIEHASGQNYTVGGPGSPALNLEVSAKSIAEFRPWENADRVFHSNHPIVNEDRGLYQELLAEAKNPDQLIAPYNSSSRPRFEHFQQTMGEGTATPDRDAIVAAFSDHSAPVCRHPEDSPQRPIVTLGCVVMELTDKPLLHLAAGPPCQTPFETYTF